MTKPVEQKQFALTAGLIALFAGFTVLAMLFVKLAWEVREKETLPFDDAVLGWVHSFESPALDRFVPVLTDVGGLVVVSLLSLVFLGALVYKRELYRALHLGLCMAGAAALNVVLKSVFERARPDLWDKLVHESSYSFPSGHSMMSAALALALVAALWNSRWRWWAVGFAALYIPLVGATRLYLGVHYPTDVLAGWLVSGAWVMAVTLLLRSRLAHRALNKIS